MKKIYVDVKSVADKEGNRNPILLLLNDGRVYDIYKIINMNQMVANTTIGLERFTCIIGNRPAYLFFEDSKWIIVRS
jgi:hypothetical protein